jgi:uncharacterized membrane protein
MVVARRIVLAIFVLTAMFSSMVFRTLSFPNDVDQAVWLGFSEIMILVLLPMLVDYLSG